MTVSHEGQQRPREEWTVWEVEHDGKVWRQAISPYIEAVIHEEGRSAAILASVLPDPRVTTLVTAARENSRFRLNSETFWRCGACTEPVDQCGCGMHEIRAALRAFDDKPDEEVERAL